MIYRIERDVEDIHGIHRSDMVAVKGKGEPGVCLFVAVTKQFIIIDLGDLLSPRTSCSLRTAFFQDAVVFPLLAKSTSLKLVFTVLTMSR